MSYKHYTFHFRISIEIPCEGTISLFERGLRRHMDLASYYSLVSTGRIRNPRLNARTFAQDCVRRHSDVDVSYKA